ncbi:hypothetical protein D3C80_1813780 [compost metagenome]
MLGGNHHDRPALSRKRFDERIDFRLGANIDTTGGLIENQYVAIGMKPLGQNYLLLIAARQA